MALLRFILTEINYKAAEIAKITQKLCIKLHFRIRKSSTKFNLEVRKHHIKLRKALIKKGLEKNGKNKNVFEFDVKKDGGIIFYSFYIIS